MKELSKSARDFHLQEYGVLREELLSLVGQINQIEKYVVAGTAIVYSWLAVNSMDGNSLPTTNIFWFIPMLFTILGSLKVYMLKKGIMKIAKYLYNLEEVFSSNNRGWQHFREKELGKKNQPSNHYLVYSYGFWGTLFLVNASVPFMMILIV